MKSLTAAEEDALWDEMFADVSYQPVLVPYVHDEFDGKMDTRGDVVRPKRRLRVRSNPALYANANTMSRSSWKPPVHEARLCWS